MNNQGFPRELLKKSKQKRFDYFKEYITEHPILDEVLAKVLRAVALSKPGQLIFVFGPTGVGKTTLIQSLNNKLIEKYFDEMNKDRNFIPVISVEAPMPTVGNFNWADLFSDMLEQLNEVGNLASFGKSKDAGDKDRKHFFEISGYNRRSKLRFVVEKSLKARKSKVVTIDEAQHLAVLASARKLLDQPNTIKSIANRTKTVHVLFGNYDLLLLNNLNGQLSRRTEDIHFSRYDYEDEEDTKSFKNIVWTFQNHLPVKKTPNLVGVWKYLYERSLGCVGILKEWLDRAYKLMLDSNDEELTTQHLEETALSESKCITIANEIIGAEGKLSRIFEDVYSLKNLLKEGKKDEDTPTKKNIRKNAQVGVRKPHRDQVGEIKNGK